MEEILASIRRIISEDDAPEPKADAPAPHHAESQHGAPVQVSPALMDETPSHEDDDVLELTDRWDEPTHQAPAAAPRPAPVESIGDIVAAPRSFERAESHEEPRSSEPPRHHAPRPVESSPEDRLVGESASHSAASAFASLAESIFMPKEGRSLEDIVREMMRPMLSEWLNQNLPQIVEAQVRAEVERIARLKSR